VFWVGLPPLRGQKSAGDIPFLNDIYINVWDGFAVRAMILPSKPHLSEPRCCPSI
jgi:hypothetical protein